MNIALFASAFYPSIGGVEELCRQFALELKRQGHSVIIVTNRWPRWLPKSEIFEGIPLYRLPFRVPEPGIKAILSYALTQRLIRHRLFAILRRHRIDLLHVQCVNASTRYAVQAKRSLHLPLVVSLQGELTMDATGLYQRSELARRILRDALHTADAITACSGKTLQDAQAFYGEPFDKRAAVIFNGVSSADFQTSACANISRPYILGIGRLVPQKGFDLLLRAYALAEVKGFDLCLAGDGSEMDNLKVLAASLGISGNVQFFGRANRQQVANLFAGCTLFVLPSREEPFGIVCLEAMAARKPVIAAAVGGVPEVIEDRKSGVLFPPGDEKALERAIRALLADSAEALRLAQGGLLRSQKFLWPEITKEYVEIYQRIQDQSRPRGVSRVN